MRDRTAYVRLIAELDVSAASGIVRRGQQLYVIADDELDLAVYDLSGTRTDRIALLPGQLPQEHAARKAAKPDFEALVALPDDSLLVLGSGSTPARRRGLWLQLTAAGVHGCVIDLAQLYVALLGQLPELNIEAGAVLGAHLYLGSRGNGTQLDNVLLQLDLARALESLARGHSLGADCVVGLHHVLLGELDGVPLSLTDLTVHEGGLAFCAAAEASANTYDDGACAGSVIGKLSPQGLASEVVRVSSELKLEGLCSAGPRELYAVADADDPHARAPLLAIEPW
jgi:hypothetical protein